MHCLFKHEQSEAQNDEKVRRNFISEEQFSAMKKHESVNSVKTAKALQPSPKIIAHGIQGFFVPGRLPGANDIIRKHHMVYSKLKSEWGLTIARCIIVAKLKRMGYCRIEFVWREKNNRRDDDNVIFGQKFILDALRDTKIIQDDRRQFIYSLTHRVVVDNARPGVEVTLIPVAVPID